MQSATAGECQLHLTKQALSQMQLEAVQSTAPLKHTFLTKHQVLDCQSWLPAFIMNFCTHHFKQEVQDCLGSIHPNHFFMVPLARTWSAAMQCSCSQRCSTSGNEPAGQDFSARRLSNHPGPELCCFIPGNQRNRANNVTIKVRNLCHYGVSELSTTFICVDFQVHLYVRIGNSCCTLMCCSGSLFVSCMQKAY